MGERSFILDASTLIYLLAPRSSARATACFEWFMGLRAAGGRFYVPALAHHEAKRGADLRALRGDPAERNALVQLGRSDRVRVLSINNRVLDVAATIWAKAKSEGFTPDDNKLSGTLEALEAMLAEGRA